MVFLLLFGFFSECKISKQSQTVLKTLAVVKQPTKNNSNKQKKNSKTPLKKKVSPGANKLSIHETQG
jgi:hypothetical protein